MKGKINYVKVVTLLLCLQVLAFSCKRESCALSSGDNARITRSLPPFNEISLYDKINLIVTQDSLQQLTVEGGKNFITGISTDVTNNVLTIKNNNKCNVFSDPGYQINVFISGNQLQKIDYYGSGNITSTNVLHAPVFVIDSWYGTGSVKLNLVASQANAIVRNNNADITISGQSVNTYVYCSEAGSVNLADLVSSNVDIEQKSIRDVYVNATGTLNAKILYKGSVFYKGQPAAIDTLITNSGRLIHL
jgi:Putative auto-transporter adhesin, head GIN domain